MNVLKSPLLFALSSFIVLFSVECLAGRYDTHSGGYIWNEPLNLITLGIAWYFARKRIKEAIEYDEPIHGLYNEWLVLSLIIVVVFIVLAVFNMPPGYYIYIHHPVLFIATVIAIFQILSSDVVRKKLLWLMIIFAYLHNPIVPVALNSKEIWIFLNIVFFISLFFTYDTTTSEEYEDDDSGVDVDGNQVEPDDSEELEEDELIDDPTADENSAVTFEYQETIVDSKRLDNKRVKKIEAQKPPNDPDVSVIIHRNLVAQIRANIHLIIPLLEAIENSDETPVKEIRKLFKYIDGEIHWRGESSVVSINNVDRTFRDYASLKAWIGNVLTKRLLEYVSD